MGSIGRLLLNRNSVNFWVREESVKVRMPRKSKNYHHATDICIIVAF